MCLNLAMTRIKSKYHIYVFILPILFGKHKLKDKMICEYVNLCVIIPLLLVGCLSTANGSALVKMGNTTVMCGIKAVSTGIHFPQILLST